MAKTLLDGVNEILKRVGFIAGDAGALTSLTDATRQREIDVAVQAINEVIDELYSSSGTPMPKEQAENTVTLVTSTRQYSLISTLVQIRWPLIDKTNAQFIYEFAGGYNKLLEMDPEEDDSGLPLWGVIRPTNGALYLYPTPTSADNGRVYTYQYDRDVSLSAYDDVVPFSDAVFRAMVPSWVQVWKREQRNEFDGKLFGYNLGRAARLMTQKQPRICYLPRA